MTAPLPVHDSVVQPVESRRWHARSAWSAWLRLGLAVAWLGLCAAVVVSGERDVDYGTLQRAIAQGDVDAVRITGDPLPSRVRGNTTVEIHWRDGWLGAVTTVMESSHGRGGHVVYDGAPDVGRDAGADLRSIEPSLEVERGAGEYGGWRLTVWGLDAPGGLVLAFAALWVVTLALLTGGPEPRLITRWGWFWLSWVAMPLGLLGFLLLSGPLRGPPPPDATVRSSHRLTGGLALLLAVVLNAVLGAVAGFVLQG